MSSDASRLPSACSPSSPSARNALRSCHSADRGLLWRLAVGQFARPRGLLGEWVGRIMAGKPDGRRRAEWTLALLDPKPTDRLLEIGFGPGLGLTAAARIASDGFVAGIDHSETMRRQAQRRLRRSGLASRAEVRTAPAESPPDWGEPFDGIFSINVVHFWDDPTAVLAGLRERLREGGRIAVTFQPPWPGATPDDALRAGEEIAAHLVQAGYEAVRLERLALTRATAACAVGRRPREVPR